MKITLIKKNGRCFIELPPEMNNFDGVELFKLKDGYYLVSVPLEDMKNEAKMQVQANVPAVNDLPNEKEKELIKKILAIRFENRTPDYISKVLSPAELELLDQIIAKGFVNVFKGAKYQKGVYNIQDKVYAQLYVGQRTANGAPAQNPQARPASTGSLPEPLVKKGYMVVGDREAAMLMDKIRDKVKKGEIKGIKGFDGNYYIVTDKFLDEYSKKVLKILESEKRVDDIVKLTKMDEEAVQAVLHLLSEAGDIIEKKKGLYVAV